MDERGFEMARRLREAHGDMSLADFKAAVRDQFYMLVLDERAALDAIAGLLPADPDARRAGLNLIRQVLAARGDLSAEEEKRLAEMTRLFGVDDEARSTRENPQRSSVTELDTARRAFS